MSINGIPVHFVYGSLYIRFHFETFGVLNGVFAIFSWEVKLGYLKYDEGFWPSAKLQPYWYLILATYKDKDAIVSRGSEQPG